MPWPFEAPGGRQIAGLRFSAKAWTAGAVGEEGRAGRHGAARGGF